MATGSGRRLCKDARRLAVGFNQFGLDLQRRLPQHSNTFFSPLSVGAALTALLPGARGNTAAEMVATLGLPPDIDEVGKGMAEMRRELTARSTTDFEFDSQRGEYRSVEHEAFRLSVATALFVAERYPLHTTFCDALTDAFQAEFFTQPFEDPAVAADRINAWVTARTEGRIRNLLHQTLLSPETRLVLANAVYFKAPWLHQFDEHGTRSLPFFPRGGERIKVPTMTQKEHFAYCADESLGVRAVDLPYREGISMLVILPDPERFDEVGTALSTGFLKRVVSGMKNESLHLRLPKLELGFSSALATLLQELGMHAAFDPTVSDFSGVTPAREGLVISEVIHKAWVKVDEEGTEAAAATAVVLIAGAASPGKPPPPIPFFVDRPFYFFIRDQWTGSVLFQGRVVDPS